MSNNIKAFAFDFKKEGYPDYAPLGACQILKEGYLHFACPGCGRFGSIKVGNPKPEPGPSWILVKGDLNKLETITLNPSIHCISCCGWHGYLINGIFTS